MKIRNKVRIILPMLILAIFLYSASIEYKREVSDQKQVVISRLQVLTAQVNQYVNQSIRNTTGVISYVQTHPDLTQEELNEFSANLLPTDDEIISHFVVLHDTTIALAYPLEGNESAIGVDLAEVESQKDVILKVKNEGISIFIGPVELVQGGSMLINRVPIFLHANTPEQEYYGQLALVIRYEPMLKKAGIIGLSDEYNVRIEQLQDTGESNEIYSNVGFYSDNATGIVIDVSNSKWKITAEPKDGFSGYSIIFFVLILTGVVFSIFIGFAVNRLHMTNELLNELVEKRTHNLEMVNEDLSNSLKKLKSTQDQLIIREKLAALGELVAGISHEINTPLGVCVTVSSYVKEKVKKLDDKLKNNKLSKSDLEGVISNLDESAEILEINLDRAAKLVNSFKQLATDQSIEDEREIVLIDYLNNVLKSISPALKKSSHSITLDIDNSVKFVTYPGALSQIFTNLTMNSLIHGFEGDESGEITISAHCKEETVVIDYFDNGTGISDENRDKIFDPFFTTNRENGGTGLGMHIIYNIVTQKLDGTIELLNIEKGVHFRIVLPVNREN